MQLRSLLLVCSSLMASACAGDDGGVASSSGGTDTGTPTCEVDGSVMAAAIDESGCVALPTDYRPLVNLSADDMWPACVTDDGSYHLHDTTPSSIARTEAYENIGALLWEGGVPTEEDFTDARAIYTLDEGLESRVLRREDLHYPAIPMEDWDASVEPDKQCSVTANVEKYPDRCAGPARIAPLMNEAFAAGQTGEGDPQVHAARIQAGALWFYLLSTYKEASTCGAGPGKDCDSAWAYYTGGTTRGNGIALAAEVAGLSSNTDSRIFDGILAARCWRDLYPEATYPTVEDAPADGQDLFARATDQLDEALHRGFALVVRDRLVRQVERSGSESTANWAFLQVAGPVLDREAGVRDPAAGAVLAGLWTMDCPGAEDLQAGIDALDTVFPCP